MNFITSFLAVSALYFSAATMAENVNEFETDLLTIQKEWASTNYEFDGKQQKKAFKSLLTQAEEFTAKFPEKAEAWIWKGIVESSYAGAKGGFSALSLAKDAKKSLKKALKINKNALNGSAYTSLGTLYHKVPGWPVGFGDDDKAKDMLHKALSINPDGIDPNYFYGEFLYDEGEYELALTYLKKAIDATPRLSRPLADKYRREEANILIAKVNKKLER